MRGYVPKGIDTLSASPGIDTREHRKAFRSARRVYPRDRSVGWVGTHEGLHYFVRGARTIFTVPVSRDWVGAFCG